MWCNFFETGVAVAFRTRDIYYAEIRIATFFVEIGNLTFFQTLVDTLYVEIRNLTFFQTFVMVSTAGHP